MTTSIRWDRLPFVAALPAARDWLAQEAGSNLSASTLQAYSRAVERYLVRCHELRLDPRSITTAEVADYFRELHVAGLGPAAIRQRYVAIRLFYACVVDRQERTDNPLDRRPAGSGSRAVDVEALPPLPWVPSEGEWTRVLTVVGVASRRTRLMLAIAYVGALRREDVPRIEVTRSELSAGRVRVKASEYDRVVALPPVVAACVEEYVGRPRSPRLLFRSESRRNANEPISAWTWAKVTRRIATEAEVPEFTSAGLRHLRLTDLARRGDGAAEIARHAGYRSPRLAYRYLRIAREHAVADVDRRRARQLEELLGPRSR